MLVCTKNVGAIEKTEKKSLLSDISEGLKYTIKQPVLIGSYLIDIFAMVFAFPVALYPALSEQWGGNGFTVSLLYSSMTIGALLISVFSKWTEKIVSHGKAIIIAASVWAVFIIFLGFAPSLYLAVICLIIAGGADTVSGIFRSTLWNEVIPNKMRGRMSGIEMISYMSGPLLGNARAGMMASKYSVATSIWSGGLVVLFAFLLLSYLQLY